MGKQWEAVEAWREVGDMERQVVGFGEEDGVKLEVKVMGGGEELRRVGVHVDESVQSGRGRQE